MADWDHGTRQWHKDVIVANPAPNRARISLIQWFCDVFAFWRGTGSRFGPLSPLSNCVTKTTPHVLSAQIPKHASLLIMADQPFVRWEPAHLFEGNRGQVIYDGPFYSKAFESDRKVKVYLPPSYSSPEGSRKSE